MFIKDIICVTNGELLVGDKTFFVDNFSIDTRTIKKDDFFISISGENFNGNDFIEDAFNKGATGVIFNGEINLNLLDKYSDKIFIKVEDTIKALQEMARFKRSCVDIPVVAITGSVGKTSTKDLVSSVMDQKYNVLKTDGNFNNHIGLPLTLLKLKDHDAMCIEIGMNHLGELSLLSNILKPTIAVITNVGTAHIGNLGTRENILKAKLEILDGLYNSNCVVINNDNDLLQKWNLEQDLYDVHTYGINNNSLIMAKSINLDLKSSKFVVDNYEYNINVPGEHFVYNSLCAITVGKLLGIEEESIKNGIKGFTLTSGRMEERKTDNNVTLLVDCYNANYDSMISALNVLGKYNTRKIALLGDMLELGEYSVTLHENVGKSVKENNIDILIVVGELSKHIAKSFNDEDNTYICNNNEEALHILKKILKPNDVLLIKASNSMKFIEIANSL